MAADGNAAPASDPLADAGIVPDVPAEQDSAAPTGAGEPAPAVR